VAVLSFFINQAPFVFSSKPHSLGADGDSWFHVAIQMHLMDPRTFAADPEVRDFYVASRPELELMIHRTVVALSRTAFRGDLLLGNIAGFWIINIIFLSGCIALGRRVLGSIAGGAAFAAASAGLSPAMSTYWGMPFGAVIPHDLGLAVVPWLVLAYLRWDGEPRAGVAVFAAVGVVANLYPLQPVFLALVLLGTTCVTRPWGARAIVARGAAFVAGALPAIVTAAIGTLHRLGSIPAHATAETTHLIERHYGHLLPSSPLVFLHRYFESPVWLFIAVAIVAILRRRRQLSDDERRLLWFGVWTAALAAIGLTAGAVSRPMLAFLFHRASAFLYIPAYLGAVAALLYLVTIPKATARLAALVLAGAVVYNAWWLTPIASRIRGVWPVRASASYYELAAWARDETPAGSLFLVPFGGSTTYFAFRVYSQRPVMLHYALGEMVLADPRLGLKFARMERDVAPLYTRPSSTAEFAAVAARYGVRFIVTDAQTPRVPEMPVVWKNSIFTVFDADRAR
jgi:hypothetical protein